MKLVGLSRQIAFSMMAMALGLNLFLLLTSSLFYYIWNKYSTKPIADLNFIPTGPELVWMIITIFAGLALAAFVAVNLSRRILVPLNSVAEGIRRVAKGELNARADSGDRSLGEAALLADNFNVLAEKLQRMAEEQTFWNAAIAHELRTPVTILRGRLQGLAEGVFLPDESQFRRLLAQVEGLSRLIEDLRIVSLEESGHLDLQWQETNLCAEIHAIGTDYEEALRSTGQHFELSLSEESVQCDPIRIRQAVLALLENVRRHAVPGTIRIRFKVKDEQCSLSVEDDGPGIAKEFAPYVFKSFRRADTERSGLEKGSGLGLAVVAAIARAHGGQAVCRPGDHGGTIFELKWPERSCSSHA